MPEVGDGGGGAGSGWDSLAEMLKATFLTAQNRVKWADLGGAIVGGLLYQILSLLVSGPLALAEAIRELIGLPLELLNAGVADLIKQVTQEFALIWDPFELGFGAALLLNVATVLGALYVGSRAYGVIVDG